MISDAKERAIALSPTRSFIVQAPAGSGKTGLLVYRLLTLLATVDHPQQIIAITFTRKATAEMRERLLELLQAAENGVSSENAFEQQGIDLAHKVLERDAQLNWKILNSPHQLQLLTIDAFCAKLTASMPWLSRLGDRPRTTDQADAHYAAAVEELLAELLNANSPVSASLQTVMLELDFNYGKARRLFTSMLAKRDQWLRHLLQNDLSRLRVTLENAWSSVVNQQLAELDNLLPDSTLAQLLKLLINAAANIKPKDGKPSMLAAFESFNTDHGVVDSDDVSSDFLLKNLSLEHWQGLSKLLLVANGKSFRKKVTITQGFVAKSADKEAFEALLSEFDGDEVLRAALYETSLLPKTNFSDQDWQQLVALEQVLKALAALLQLRFRAVGECDHSEVTQRANLALQELENPTDLGLRMDYHLHHILVDEFQDTSNGQIELLKKLTAGWTEFDAGPPKTLFLVGDPMQSIYRFREADVSLFLQVVQNQQTGIFENLNIESLRLTENFRSSGNLVAWFNATFANSFPIRNSVLTGAICYAQASSSKGEVSGGVDYLLAHSRMQEGELLVKELNKAIAELPSADSKVAILVRTRGQLNYLLPALKDAGITYMGVDIQPLRELQAVIDVFALCKAICREDDRVSWLALLRGPWCGLSLSQIKKLVGRNDLTVWQQLNRDLPALDADSLARVERFKSIMQQTLAQRQQVELGSLTRWVWRCLGGEQTLFGADLEDIETVFTLIDKLQKGGDLPSVNDIDKALSGLYALPNTNLEQSCQLVVSTMHKAKGLQYDTVILPGLSNQPRADDKEILMWAEHQSKDGKLNLLLAPLRSTAAAGDHFDYLRKLDSKRALNETVRLMYVAATRAERKLILMARAEVDSESGEIKNPRSGSLLATVWEATQDKFNFLLDSQPDLAEEALPQTLERLPSDYETEFSAPLQWQVEQQLNAQEAMEFDETIVDSPENSDSEDVTKEFEWATNAASGVGTVLHRWLQYNASNVLTVKLDQALLQRWRSELIALRVPEVQIEYAIRNLKQAVDNIKSDKQAHFIFKHYETEQNEYALSTYEDGIVKKSIIDRTFVDDNDIRWIVDYKSTPTRASDLQAFAQQQVELRHRQQLQRYGELMSKIDKRQIKLAVYFPMLKQLISWTYKPLD